MPQTNTRADIVTDLIGGVKLEPLAITLDTPDAATAIDGTLHVVGSHNGQAARQLVDLAVSWFSGNWNSGLVELAE